jgi:ParB/RepB/Spo0J family partition protein
MIIKEIPLDSIEIIDNIRQIVHDEDFVLLMQSIKFNGLMQPIGVKESSKNNYKLIWGNRRYKAYKKLGWKTIPAVIFFEQDDAMSEEDFFVLNAVENLHHKQNSLYELGRICKILKTSMSNSEIAIRLGISKQRVDSALVEMSRIPEKWQKKIKLIDKGKGKGGNIPLSTATKVGRLRGLSTESKDKIFEHISKNDKEVSGKKIELIGSLMKEKKEQDINKILETSDKYKVIKCEVFVDKAKLDTALKQYKTVIDLICASLNEKIPNLAFKNIRGKF